MKSRIAATRGAEPRSTRDLILDVAEARFAERGFAGVSVREIATDVGLKNQASLYHHFKNKRALYEAVLGRGVEAIVTMVAASSPHASTSSAADVLDATLGRVIDYLVEHPHLPRLIQRAGLDDTKYMRSSVTHVLRPLYQQGLEIMAATNTSFARDELPQVGAGLYHLIFGYFANAKLIEAVIQEDPLSPVAVAHQRRFVMVAVASLLGIRRNARVTRIAPSKAPT